MAASVSAGSAVARTHGVAPGAPGTKADWAPADKHGFATSGLHRTPDSVATAAERSAYTVSELVLAASEEKTYRGAYVASPTMPWA